MKSRILGLLAVSFLVLPHVSHALVVGTANSNNCYPFSCTGPGNFQQGYSALAFGGAFTITSLSFFEAVTPIGSHTLLPGTFSLYLSTTSDPVMALTGLIGADETLVYSGTAPPNSTGAFGGRHDFVLSTPFFYDPSVKNLLLRVAFSGSESGPVTFLDADASGLLMGRYYTDIVGSSRNVGLVTGFNLVPEPGTLALFTFGLAGLGLSRRRRTA